MTGKTRALRLAYVLAVSLVAAQGVWGAVVPSSSFSPIYVKDAAGRLTKVSWTYVVNGGQPLEATSDFDGTALNLTMRYSALQVSVDPRTQRREVSFSATFTGDATGTCSAKVTEDLADLEGQALILNQHMKLDMKIRADGESATIAANLLAEFTPSVEWFLDRDDLDQLGIGFVSDDQGAVEAQVTGSVCVSAPGYGRECEDVETSASSPERWKIVDMLDWFTVQGRSYHDVVVVERETEVPATSFDGASDDDSMRPVTMTYWVARGVGTIKGIGQYSLMGQPLAVELQSSSVPQSPPPTVSARIVGLADNVATVSITVGATATHYTVMADTWDVQAATWVPVPGTLVRGTRTFTHQIEVPRVTGKHGIFVAAMDDDAGQLKVLSQLFVTLKGPAITAITPSMADPGNTITITGKDFGVIQGTVFFGDVETPHIQSWTAKSVVCQIPQAGVAAGVAVAVQDARGMRSLPKTIWVRPPWLGTWVGDWERTADTGVPEGMPLESGHTILWLSQGPGNKVAGKTADGDTFSATLVQGDLVASWKDTRGIQHQWVATVSEDSIEGTHTSGGFDSQRTAEFALHRPQSPRPSFQGVYVAGNADIWQSSDPYGDEPATWQPWSLFQFRQSGNTLTATLLGINRTLTGFIEDNVFVLRSADGTTAVTGVADTDGGQVTGFAGFYAWTSDGERGWGETCAEGSSGTAGVAAGATDWDVDVESMSGGWDEWDEWDEWSGGGQAQVRVTVTGTAVAITWHDGFGTARLSGKIHDRVFVARGGKLILYGTLDDGEITGTYEYTGVDGGVGHFEGQPAF